MQKTAIIIPCYNESSRLDINEFINFAKDNKHIYFIFVNDGSTDETAVIINDLCSSYPDRMLCVNLKSNHGKAEAVRKGFLKAFEIDFMYIGYWDADLSTPLQTINIFCDLFDRPEISIVIGARVKLLGRNIERLTIRHYLGRIFATCASSVLRVAVYDTQCGAKLFRNNSDLKKVFSQPFNVNWTFDVEILARYKIIEKNKNNTLKNNTIEYPLESWSHKEDSKVKKRDFFTGFIELLKILMLLYAPAIANKYSKKFVI